MRAPGEALGHDGAGDRDGRGCGEAGIDPVEFRVDQRHAGGSREAGPSRSRKRQLVQCLQLGAERFGWSRRKATPGQVREGQWLIGHGMAAAFRNNLLMKSKARVKLDRHGVVTVETDMTDIGTGSYTIIAQTAAETMGVPLDKVVVRLGDSDFPVSAGSGGQFGANNSTSGVYAACMKLREAVAKKAGLAPADARFADGRVSEGRARDAAGRGRGRRGARRRGRHRVRRSRQEVPAVDLRRALRRGGRGRRPPARSACAACWPCAPPAASSTRCPRAAR